MTRYELCSDPHAYGLPFPDWNTNQKEACETALNLRAAEVLILELPCGGGKSGVPALVSHFRPQATILVATTDLQSQYSDSFSFMETIWGQARPPNFCVHQNHIDEFQAIYGVKPFRSECKFRKAQECPDFSSCPYEAARMRCIDAQAKVLNYHYGYYARWWRKHTFDLFCDEAHRLPIVLSDLVSVEVKESTRKKFVLPEFPLAMGGSKFAIQRAREWLDRSAQALLLLTKARDIKVIRRVTRMRENFSSLAQALSMAEEAEWCISSKPGRSFLVKPVVPGPFSKALLIPEARSYVLMSATIGDASVLASELGIEGNYQFQSYPHPFPPENRPVIFVKSSPKLKYDSPPSDYKKQLEIIKWILDEHRYQRGIIHTASWKHARMIATAISGDDRRIILPEAKKRIGSIKAFKYSELGTVAVSPSWHEGLNFPDDEARFCIIAKIPWQSLANPVVKLRLQRKGGRAWFDWNAALTVVQSAGRIVRHAEDWGTTYIIDGHWPRVSRKAPQWFKWEQA